MKLSKLRVETFKRVEEIEIDLSDVNILVGANGSGKSSIIQAVHLACCLIRQADRVDPKKTATVGIEELDYLPTDDYKTLGHGANWGNKEQSPCSRVTLTFEDPINGITKEAKCTLRSARNAGISISGNVPTELTSSLRNKNNFFSAYIPGISGIPNKEERKSKKSILKSCSFGDSNIILRNALLLLHNIDPNNIRTIERWIEEILGPISIHVSHDEDKDLWIKCEITIGNNSKPIELAGTGFLQLIQIFCYVLLFKPGVVLIDEPDIHLHPNVQEKLAGALSLVARERGLKVILTTHSPFIVRSAPAGTNVCWLQDGKTASNNRTIVELALGWGAFGKKVIVISEDQDTTFLRKLISQWKDIDRAVAFYPGTGYKSLATPSQAKELSESLGRKFKILVHRDRDSLTDDEIQRISRAYEAEGINIWFPEESDLEAYFCQPAYLQSFLSCTLEEAEEYLTSVINRQSIPIRQQFDSQRSAHNQELHAHGGSSTNDDVWQAFQQRTLKGAKGKFVLKQLKNAVPRSAYSEAKIQAHELGGRIALDLKAALERVLAN